MRFVDDMKHLNITRGIYKTLFKLVLDMFFCATNLHLCLQHIIMHIISVYLNAATILHKVIHTVYLCLSQQEFRTNIRFLQWESIQHQHFSIINHMKSCSG